MTTILTKTGAFALILAAFISVPFSAAQASHDWNNDDELSCWITADQQYVSYGGSTTLRYSSDNADEGWISDIGDVSVNERGSETVTNIKHTTTFTFTVQDEDGDEEECSTTIYVYGSGNYYNQPACTITLSNFRYGQYGYDNTATLNWTSTNAEKARISDIGSVGLNGVQTVSYPNIKHSYTMTVENEDGEKATCSTSQYNQPTYPQYPQYNYPFVSLTQIPYTGFDLGVVGTFVYFGVLALFAVSGAYLLAYYQGGALRYSFARDVAAAARNQIRFLRMLVK